MGFALGNSFSLCLIIICQLVDKFPNKLVE